VGGVVGAVAVVLEPAEAVGVVASLPVVGIERVRQPAREQERVVQAAIGQLRRRLAGLHLARVVAVRVAVAVQVQERVVGRRP